MIIFINTFSYLASLSLRLLLNVVKCVQNNDQIHPMMKRIINCTRLVVWVKTRIKNTDYSLLKLNYNTTQT